MIKKTVLIIDDHKEWCFVLKATLDSDPFFEVLPPVHNGKDALASIIEHKPDAILLDLVMPLYDGMFIISYIRDQMAGYNPILYVISAVGTQKTNSIMHHLDVNYYSVKPIDTIVVANNLHRFFDDTAYKLPEAAYDVKDSEGPLMGTRLSQPIELDTYIEDYLFEMGAPLYRLSTKCMHMALKLCILEESRLSSITSLYEAVAKYSETPATAASIERNMRSAIIKMQKNATPKFSKHFPYGQTKLTNSEFLHSSVYLLKREIEDMFGETNLSGEYEKFRF